MSSAATVTPVSQGGVVIEADLTTVLAVGGLILAAVVLSAVIRRWQWTRLTRRVERLVFKAVAGAFDERLSGWATPPPESSGRGSGHDSGATPAGRAQPRRSATDLACNWLVALCVLAVVIGLVGGSQHLTWAGALGFLVVPLVVAPVLTRRERRRGSPPNQRGWSALDSWWRVFTSRG
ncbi:MAG: hypothetical protein OXF41_15665 [bacterium]|nr:hypothetical protein [bacterium]